MVGGSLVLRVVTELLGGGGVAKEEGEGGEHILAGGRKGGRGRKVGCHCCFGGCHFVCVCV